MGWLSRIEETCAAFIERAFAGMFPSDLEPALIARKLVATMEARTQNIDGMTNAPGAYHVYVNPVDYARLMPHREYLQNECSALLSDVSRRVGIHLSSPARVELYERGDVVAGAIEVESVVGEYALRIVKGLTSGASHRIPNKVQVGRSADADIVLTDPSVSRHHAVLALHDGDLFLTDSGSSNGTFVNGKRVQSCRLEPGDIVAFGKTEARVERS